MSVTLGSLDKLKTFIVESSEFRAKNEDEALQVVFLLWGILLGCHKIFDGSGRGHLFAFSREDFIDQVVQQIMVGIAKPTSQSKASTENSLLLQERPSF
jgi:hypothetical protein